MFYVSEERIKLFITFCNYYRLYPIINEIVYSCHFHNFDLLSVLSFCVFFVQSFVITPKRPLSFTSTVLFCVLHPLRCNVLRAPPLHCFYVHVGGYT